MTQRGRHLTGLVERHELLAQLGRLLEREHRPLTARDDDVVEGLDLEVGRLPRWVLGNA